ncbi:DUF2852 domain-containing protein [Phyllobacterium leguminum]|uniref:Uncharacterized protein DUF2852 n=1 Tax=Phyllobacterium leguminum TaxID=314237 RepID=A0A318T0U2_9HYPH|nr:DUF2852 domain-containing protein [Phyllobacterium leguminum]PYE86366.1 uncharacterized protein DUF2852 [Phyllobacterium leguminum]
MNSSALIRPAWTPATIALMIIGFMIYWPLGLAMLAYILWGDRLEGFKHDVNNATDGIFKGFRNACPRGAGSSGNAAFDEWRAKELERLAEERRKLDEARADFEAYAREVRRAKDKEEFDRFKAERRSAGKKTPAAPTEITDIG